MIVTIVQYIYYFLFHIPSKIIFKSKITIPKDLELKKPIIIISNHNSMLDPFLLTLLPFSLVRKLIPIYAPTSARYHKNIFITLLIRPMGSYPLKRWSWSFEDIFDKTLKDLEKGRTLLIFPEGRITKKGEKIKAKSGFLFLASKFNTSILPIRIIKDKNKVSIKVLDEIKKDHKINDKEANKIMKKLYSS